MRLSVITPVFNRAGWIAQCINNVIDQKCDDAEHVIVDGGSTDGTVDVIRAYAARHPHIVWVSEKDRGQSDAMNKGIAMARGVVIGFLNVDDYYEPGVLCRVLELFEHRPEPALLVGNCNVWNSQGALQSVFRPGKLDITNMLLGPAVSPHPPNPSAYFYHKSLHDKIGLYDVDDHFAMDLDFMLRAVQSAYVSHVDETWGNFRMLEDTKTVQDFQSGGNDDRQRQIFDIYRSRLNYRQLLIYGLKRIYYGNSGIRRVADVLLKRRLDMVV
ncbi:MAG: glycosyltransferase [Nitrospirae bacterium]|nr:glycosyltransferase [Nitrospirota bacterium]